MSAAADELGAQLLYGACWEDLAVARAALRIPRHGTVVAVGAAGDNVIGLLLDDPARILAVDVNPAQSALVELKLAAVRAAPGAVAAFVGGTGAGVATDPTRLDRYERLRGMLSGAAVGFWDAYPRDIERGVIHAGRLERYLAWFRRGVLPIVPGRPAVRAMLAAPSISEQRRIYREAWDTPAWRCLFRICFSRWALAALGRHPAFFDQAPRGGVGAHYLARATEGLTATPISRNPYATFMLEGRYRVPEAVPAYLHPRHAAVLAARTGRVAIATCSMLDALRDLPDASVDAFYLSDIFELAEPVAYEACLREVVRTGRPGARLCYWNNLVARTRPESLAGGLASRTALAQRLHACDRAFLYARLVVEEVRPSARARVPRSSRATESEPEPAAWQCRRPGREREARHAA